MIDKDQGQLKDNISQSPGDAQGFAGNNTMGCYSISAWHYCVHCGARVEPHWRFCPHCAYRLHTAPASGWWYAPPYWTYPAYWTCTGTTTTSTDPHLNPDWLKSTHFSGIKENREGPAPEEEAWNSCKGL